MTRIHVLLAKAEDVKARCGRTVQQAKALLTQNADAQFTGHSTRFEPLYDSPDAATKFGPTPPEEHKPVPRRAHTILDALLLELGLHLDVEGDVRAASAKATADLVIGDKKLLENVPVAFLLQLEQQLQRLIDEIISKLPIIKGDREWRWDPQNGVYKTDITQSFRPVKVRNIVTLSPPTDKHPAQVNVFNDDVPAFKMYRHHMSGAVTESEAREIMEFFQALYDAVKMARKTANESLVEPLGFGSKLAAFIHTELEAIRGRHQK